MNIVKTIYDKYHNYNERMIDVVTEVMKDANLTVEEMTEIIKNEPKLLSIFKHECMSFNLVKEEKNSCEFNLTSLFL